VNSPMSPRMKILVSSSMASLRCFSDRVSMIDFVGGARSGWSGCGSEVAEGW
jgi:hypothetical protein